MTAATVNRDRDGACSGAQTLALLSTPLNALILRALADGPRTQVEIRRDAGSPAQSTLRTHLNGLEKTGVIAKHRRDSFPGTVECELQDRGKDMRIVSDTLERWLTVAPHGALTLGGEPSRSAIKALVEGWSTTMVGILATQPVSLTEMDRLIPEVSYPSLERRLGTMRTIGQIKTLPGGPRGTPYAVTEWLRRGVAPLIAAAHWEIRNDSSGGPVFSSLDAEAIFMLSLPLLKLSPELSGECRLAVEVPREEGPALAGVLAKVEGGRVDARVMDLNDDAGAGASGPVEAWLSTVVEADTGDLELSGDRDFAQTLLSALHSTLFGVESEQPQAVLK